MQQELYELLILLHRILTRHILKEKLILFTAYAKEVSCETGIFLL